MRVNICFAAGIIILTGCQGTPVGDAMIGKQKLAQMDDQYCRSIGAKPSSPEYVQCREFKTAQRDQSHQLAFQRAAAGLRYTGQSMQTNANIHRSIDCTSRLSGNQVRTTCD